MIGWKRIIVDKVSLTIDYDRMGTLSAANHLQRKKIREIFRRCQFNCNLSTINQSMVDTFALLNLVQIREKFVQLIVRKQNDSLTISHTRHAAIARLSHTLKTKLCSHHFITVQHVLSHVHYAPIAGAKFMLWLNQSKLQPGMIFSSKWTGFLPFFSSLIPGNMVHP